jgi:hypothetical protein
MMMLMMMMIWWLQLLSLLLSQEAFLHRRAVGQLLIRAISTVGKVTVR